MTQDEKEQFEVLLRKQLLDQTQTRGTTLECPDPEWITAYLEERLSAANKAAFERHFSGCSRCQEELAFLLKTISVDAAERQRDPYLILSKPSKWLKLNWVKPAFLKPVFTILVILIVSGVLGYRIIIQREPTKEKVTQIADSMASRVEAPKQEQPTDEDRVIEHVENFPPARNKAQSEGRPTPELEKSPQTHTAQAANAERQFAPVHKSQSSITRIDSGDVNTEPPREEAEGSKEVEKKQEELKEEAPARPGAGGASVPSPVSAPVLHQELSERDSGMKEQKLAEGKNLTAQTLKGNPATGNRARSGIASKKAMATRQKVEPTDEVASAPKPEETKGKFAQIGGLLSSPVRPRHIQVGGKTFEFDNNVWVDQSIAKDQNEIPQTVRKGSPEYVSLEKELSIYQEILDRPEDCLIMLNGRIYRIQKNKN